MDYTLVPVRLGDSELETWVDDLLDDAVHLLGQRLEVVAGVLRVVLPQEHSDVLQARPVHAVGGGGHEASPHQHAPALEARDADVRLPRQLPEVRLVAPDYALLQIHSRNTTICNKRETRRNLHDAGSLHLSLTISHTINSKFNTFVLNYQH